MKINRHNYETFFLLYTDNELTQPERLEVEQFVQENPDLQDEFLSFKRLVLPPEDIHFDQKEGLFKNEIQEEQVEAAGSSWHTTDDIGRDARFIDARRAKQAAESR